jgi:hypothetical protein
MQTVIVPIPAHRIVDRESFHAVFREALGFPDFYGQNMDAWIDCLTDYDEPGRDILAGDEPRVFGMTALVIPPNTLLTLRIDGATDFARRCPKQHAELIECTAIVNERRVSDGKAPVLALLF